MREEGIVLEGLFDVFGQQSAWRSIIRGMGLRACNVGYSVLTSWCECHRRNEVCLLFSRRVDPMLASVVPRAPGCRTPEWAP